MTNPDAPSTHFMEPESLNLHFSARLTTLDTGPLRFVPRQWFDLPARIRENKRVPPMSGPVAQLGARFHGMEEVIGSIPIRSTKYLNNLDN
jgi:hypothetical protein